MAPNTTPNTTPVKQNQAMSTLHNSPIAANISLTSPEISAGRNKTTTTPSNNNHPSSLSSNSLKNMGIVGSMVDTSMARAAVASPALPSGGQFHNLVHPNQQTQQSPRAAIPSSPISNLLKPNTINPQLNLVLQNQYQNQLVNSLSQMSPYQQQFFLSYMANMANNSNYIDPNIQSDTQQIHQQQQLLNQQIQQHHSFNPHQIPQQHLSQSLSQSTSLPSSHPNTPPKSVSLPKTIIDSSGTNTITNN